MDEKMINRHLRREFRIPGWLLIGYYVLMNVLAFATVFVDAMQQTIQSILSGDWSGPDMTAILSNAWGYLICVAIAMLFLFEWKGPSFWRDQVLTREKKMRAGTFLVLLCLCMTTQFVNSFWISGLEYVMNLFDKSILEALESVSGDSDTFSMFLYASIVAPISEEIIFRGYIQGSLQRYGKRFAILCSAFLFGIFHGNLVQTPYAFLMGLILGYTAMHYHIGWAIGLHMFNNLVLADLLTRLTEQLPEMVTAILNWGLLGGATVITGIVMLLKRGQIAAYLHNEWVDRRCLKCFFTNSGVIILTVIMAVNALLILVM